MRENFVVRSLLFHPRIKMLLAMLRWDVTPEKDETRYMTIEPNEYTERPVLPTPLQIMGIRDNRRFPPLSVASSQVIEKPKPKKKIKDSQDDSQENTKRGNSGDGNSYNAATARPAKPPKPKK
ncbi:hypothetical protein I8748_15390 [Nostoc sp. CENA67]|uniref:Uncharacterized protein n=1 Tax=Amazonocrinis nigriterrae CENA67 TaxID=2794033 RepID=A0A8J7HUF8_9NOST|nr:hypothetical protein [Amazonocrinis nigriterrae]MBH8563555.1 hypothetical protein [Amazonocrinis nigriterrae CENA67]